MKNSNIKLSVPTPEECDSFYRDYIEAVEEDNPLDCLHSDLKSQFELLDTSPGLKLEYRYSPDKWSLRELLVHLIDTERVMSWRLLAALRSDPNNYPGYDHLHYVEFMGEDKRSWVEIRKEWKSVRNSLISLIEKVEEKGWDNYCFVDGNKLTARAIVFIIVGHTRVHFQTIQKRYLP